MMYNFISSFYLVTLDYNVGGTMTKIKKRLCSFPYIAKEPLEDTVRRNALMALTMTQEEFDCFCDHDITDEEKSIIDDMATKGMFVKDNDGAYCLTDAGRQMIIDFIS